MTPLIRFPEFTDTWQTKQLSDILDIGSGRDYKHLKSGDVPVYGTGGLMTHVNDYLYDGKSVAIGRKGTIDQPQFLTGKFWTVDTLFYTHNYKNATPEFVYSIFENINWKKWNEASGVPSLSSSTIKNIKVSIPKKPEQQRIADFLTTVDKRIAASERKSELLARYKRGVMQQLFSQKIRFKKSDESDYPDWQSKKLSEVFEERTGKGGKHENMLSVTIRNGVVPFSTIDRKDNSNLDKSNYKQVKVGDIAYNSMRMWQGASGVSDYDGIVSPAYTVIMPKSGNISSFWGYYFKLSRVIFNFYRYSQGLTSDTWNLKFRQLSEISLLVPSPEEQQKIADFLTALDDRITVEHTKLTAAKQFKKALLQRMFV